MKKENNVSSDLLMSAISKLDEVESYLNSACTDLENACRFLGCEFDEEYVGRIISDITGMIACTRNVIAEKFNKMPGIDSPIEEVEEGGGMILSQCTFENAFQIFPELLWKIREKFGMDDELDLGNLEEDAAIPRTKIIEDKIEEGFCSEGEFLEAEEF